MSKGGSSIKARRKLDLAEKQAKVKDMRPIDDVFFEVLAGEPGVLQEMLRTILEDPRLTVDEESIVAQRSEKNLYGRSVRLDALCVLGDGTITNVEVQRSDNDDHARRVRYNASIITVKESRAGDNFKDIANVCVVYISEFDFLKGGRTIYHVDKIARETGQIVDDGLREVFVNTVVDDGTDISDLMSCFTKKEVKSQKFPALSNAVSRLKSDEKGVSAVCKVMQQYEDKAREEGRIEEREANIGAIIKNLMKENPEMPLDKATATAHALIS